MGETNDPIFHPVLLLDPSFARAILTDEALAAPSTATD